MNAGYKIVLTADRTLMSEYAGNIFFGFSASAPRGFLPDWFYFHFLCPSVSVNRENGEAFYAPVGLRKIEAKLLECGFHRDEVIIAHPDYLNKAIGRETKVVSITTFDPLGIGPVTSTFSNLFGGDKAYNTYKFSELIKKPVLKKYHPKVVVGGPGAWQLMNECVQKVFFGIDTVVLGEAENTVGPLFKDAVAGKPLPRLVKAIPVGVEDIPNVVGPTICGLVEVSRGCGRGCDFCNPALTQLKSRRIDAILEDVKVNVRHGRDSVILHSEDIFRYGATGIYPNQQSVENLFKAVLQTEGVRKVAVSHGAFASIVSAPTMLPNISEMMHLDKRNWRGYQVGLETGSPRLLKNHMAGKCKPFAPEEWPEVVRQATGISNDANWFPVSTLIIGLPGETSDDIMKTLELADDLAKYQIMIYPLLAVPTGRLSEKDCTVKENLLPEHVELFLRCWEISLELWPKTFKDISGGLRYSFIEKAMLRTLLNIGVSWSLRKIQTCKSSFQDKQPFKIGKNTFQVSNQGKLMSVISTGSSSRYEGG
ncbi:radical SAM protein [Methanoregula sp.]|uniref:B12-binding domain-containing radical SAM protein n=1 Tax=Methanoregula sp. TaxID=2052170 RepID=UPI00260A08E1|nr:radical SAM protein [Methanoregula sp.]MDD5143707.1 radical SAM protein [Methanoregula sp.]